MKNYLLKAPVGSTGSTFRGGSPPGPYTVVENRATSNANLVA